MNIVKVKVVAMSDAGISTSGKVSGGAHLSVSGAKGVTSLQLARLQQHPEPAL